MVHKTRHGKPATPLAEETVTLLLISNCDSLDDRQQTHPTLLQRWDELRKYCPHIK